jgi:putative intracellular protease/amidase
MFTSLPKIVGLYLVANTWSYQRLSDHNFFQDKFDVLVIPGGAKGAETMSTSSAIQDLVREYIKKKKFVAMICAGLSHGVYAHSEDTG